MWSTLDGLFEVVEGYDFGLFVFAPDDDEEKAGEKMKAVRSNVILELGLFLGALGRDRTFAVMWEPVPTRSRPRVRRQDRIRPPTDLLGITIPTFQGHGPALTRSIEQAASAIRRRIQEQGRRPSRLDLHQGWGYDFTTRQFYIVIPGDRFHMRQRLKGHSLLVVARVHDDSVLAEDDPNLAIGKPLRVPTHVRQNLTLEAGGRIFAGVEPGDAIAGYLFVLPPRFRMPRRPTITALVNAGADLIATQGARAKQEAPPRRSPRRRSGKE